ncbi:hypothetical protein [Lancefieldella rimae]
MRKLVDLCDTIERLSLPFAQIEFDTTDGTTPPGLPFVLLVPETTQDVIADGVNFVHITPYRVELYTSGRDMDIERRFEVALNESGFSYTRRTVPLGDGVLETTYTVTVYGQ